MRALCTFDEVSRAQPWLLSPSGEEHEAWPRACTGPSAAGSAGCEPGSVGFSNRPQSGEATEGRAVSMSRKYEIYSGRKVVSTQFSVSASQAVIDYVRSHGREGRRDHRIGVDSVSWRGAQFKAVLVPAESPFDAMRTARLIGRT